MSMNLWPVISIYGVINRRKDCPYYSVKADTCEDGLYKICSPKRCLRLQGFKKAKQGDHGRKREKAESATEHTSAMKLAKKLNMNAEQLYDYLAMLEAH